MTITRKEYADIFKRAIKSFKNGYNRAELTVDEIPAPQTGSPFAFAFAAGTRENNGLHRASGRLVLMYDPDEPEGWNNCFRIVCFAQSPLDVEMGSDPTFPEVVWQWLVEGLDNHGAQFNSASGTTNISVSTGFGGLAHFGTGAKVEFRGSWSPLGDNFGAHFEGWGALLCAMAGLPPEGTFHLNQNRV